MFSNCFEYSTCNTSEAKSGTRLQAFFTFRLKNLDSMSHPVMWTMLAQHPLHKVTNLIFALQRDIFQETFAHEDGTLNHALKQICV